MPRAEPVHPTRYTDAVKLHGTQRAAAAAMDRTLSTVQAGMLREQKRAAKLALKKEAAAAADKADTLGFPKFSRKHPTTAEIIERLSSEVRLKTARAKEEKWFNVHVRDEKPIGVLWVGDPHLGVLCNWDRLQRDVAHLASVPGLYGANIGDIADNWVGSLMRIAAEQDISRRSERQLAQWFLGGAGITWLVWLMGNHDEWNDGADFMRLMDVHNKVPMFDWVAKFQLLFPNGARCRIRASHDFPGHSMWNPTHGPARTPRMLGDGADLYVCGHKHTWGTQSFEMPEADRCITAIRARGYKVMDPHARRLGFPEDQHGCSVLTIIDPNAEQSGRVLTFVDVDQGVRVLQALRGDKPPAVKRRAPKTKGKVSKKKR